MRFDIDNFKIPNIFKIKSLKKNLKDNYIVMKKLTII